MEKDKTNGKKGFGRRIKGGKNEKKNWEKAKKGRKHGKRIGEKDEKGNPGNLRPLSVCTCAAQNPEESTDPSIKLGEEYQENGNRFFLSSTFSVTSDRKTNPPYGVLGLDCPV